ncbi:MAG: DUF4854 domain-containing protein [Propionibacteriaceae bacterium]|jgi:hypothetical protein|nr:DUF4854 domain-containing protein [Propionibacteriaceae bacterium]
MKNLVRIPTLVLLALLVVSGCASGSPIEQFVAAGQSQVDSVKESFGDTFSSVELSAEGENTIVYTYVFGTEQDIPTISAGFESTTSTLQSGCDEAVFPAMRQAGISDPAAKYVYLNPDGTEVWSTYIYPSAEE